MALGFLFYHFCSVICTISIMLRNFRLFLNIVSYLFILNYYESVITDSQWVKNNFEVAICKFSIKIFFLSSLPKLYITSTLNIDLILWHTQLIVCAENVKSWFKSWVFPFTFQAYILLHTLNCKALVLPKHWSYPGIFHTKAIILPKN